MQYFHRTSVSPEAAMARAAAILGARLAPVSEGARRRSWSGALGTATVTVAAEGGHYTLVTIATDQLTESELDKLAKQALGEIHRLAEPTHELRGAY